MRAAFPTTRLILLGALVALSLPACRSARSGVGAWSAMNRPSGAAQEKVFSVDWWVKADDGFFQPYKPREPGSPEVDPRAGRVFAATSDGKVHAFRHGREVWVVSMGAPFNAGPTFHEGTLYAASSNGRLAALEAASGKLLWEYRTGDEFLTRPAIADGAVYVTGASDTLYAVDAASGKWLWQYRRDPPGDFTVRGAARPLASGGRVFAGFADGYAVALDARDGSLAWAKELASGKQFIDVDADPATDGLGHVFFGTYARGVSSLDAASGEARWSVPLPGVTSIVYDADHGVVIAGGSEAIAALGAEDGLVRWKLALGRDRFVSGLTLTAGMLLASTGPGPLLFVDPKDGRVRHSFDPGFGVAAAPTPAAPGEMVVLSNRGYLYGLDLVGAP